MVERLLWSRILVELFFHPYILGPDHDDGVPQFVHINLVESSSIDQTRVRETLDDMVSGNEGAVEGVTTPVWESV